jgi:hypothetical protein
MVQHLTMRTVSYSCRAVTRGSDYAHRDHPDERKMLKLRRTSRQRFDVAHVTRLVASHPANNFRYSGASPPQVQTPADDYWIQLIRALCDFVKFGFNQTPGVLAASLRCGGARVVRGSGAPRPDRSQCSARETEDRDRSAWSIPKSLILPPD